MEVCSWCTPWFLRFTHNENGFYLLLCRSITFANDHHQSSQREDVLVMRSFSSLWHIFIVMKWKMWRNIEVNICLTAQGPHLQQHPQGSDESKRPWRNWVSKKQSLERSDVSTIAQLNCTRSGPGSINQPRLIR